MTLVPTMVPTAAPFRGPSSSDSYNTVQRAAYNDILNAFVALQAQNAATLLANEILTNQNSAAATAIAALTDQYAALGALYTSLKTFGSSANSTGTVTMTAGLHDTPVSYGGFPSYFPQGNPMSQAARAVYSPLFGQITPSLSIAPISKAYVADLVTGTLVFPPGIAALTNTIVTPTLDPYTVEQTDIGLCVDGSSATYWRQNVYFPTNQSVSDVSATVTLTLPPQYVNNLLCNYVTIFPYPEYGIDVTSVLLHSAPGSADVQLLPTDAAGNIIALSGAGKTRLLFPEQQVVSIDVTLRQSTPNMNMQPGLQCFILGAAVLDFGYLTFNQSPSTVLIPFSLSSNFFNFVNAVGPTVPGVSYALYYLDPAVDLVAFNLGDTLPAFVNTLYIAATLTPTQGVLPVLESVWINFAPTYTLN